MVRILTAFFAAGLLAVGLLVLAGYLAYGTAPTLSGEVDVEGLSAPVTVGFAEKDVPVIAAENEADLFTGLGYMHALQSAWPMALWRQTATSGLSAWFDDAASDSLDRHTLALGFEALARTTYEALPSEDRALLDAYARGVNRAFDRSRLNEGDEFVLLDVRAEPWRPWDALAVERLVAYLATPPIATDSAGIDARRRSRVLQRFAASDSLLRTTLHLDGLDHALAFTRRNSAGITLVQRHVHGRSALPFYRELVVRQGGRSTLVASIPGTLVLPAGYGDHAWSVLLSGDVRLAPSENTAPDPSFARLVARDGDETLVEIYRRDGTLFLFDNAEPAPQFVRDSTGTVVDTLVAPSIWTVRWRGFATGTDLGAWRTLLRGQTPTFSLLSGDGLFVDSDMARVLGTPPVVRDVPGGTLVGQHRWAGYVADRLNRVEQVPLDPDALLSDTYSTWAADLAPPLVATLGGPDDVAEELRDASAYLRSWNYRYAPSSIGASIFDTWMAVYQTGTGSLPDLAAVTAPLPPADSLGRVPERPIDRALETALRRALDLLGEEHGEIGAAWRWQNVQHAVRHYPLFARSAGSSSQRFTPILQPDGGHPTTLAWGLSPAFLGPEATSSWAAQGTIGGERVEIRHRRLYDATYQIRERLDPVEPYTLARTATPEAAIRLLRPTE